MEAVEDVSVVGAICVAADHGGLREQLLLGAVVNAQCDLDVLEHTRVNDGRLDILSECGFLHLF